MANPQTQYYIPMCKLIYLYNLIDHYCIFTHTRKISDGPPEWIPVYSLEFLNP